MSYAYYLKELLRPLGVYRLDGQLNGGELNAQGAALDRIEAMLDELQREADLTTANSWGLERISELFVRTPVTDNPRMLAQALAALIRISGDSFTLKGINDALCGCGIKTEVVENGTGSVTVSFPDTRGIPEGFEEMREIIEDTLPPHLEIVYFFVYTMWQDIEQANVCWQDVEDRELDWEAFETQIWR